MRWYEVLGKAIYGSLVNCCEVFDTLLQPEIQSGSLHQDLHTGLGLPQSP